MASKTTEQSSPAHWHEHTTATPSLPPPFFLSQTEIKCISLLVCRKNSQKTIIVGLEQTQLDGYGGKKENK